MLNALIVGGYANDGAFGNIGGANNFYSQGVQFQLVAEKTTSIKKESSVKEDEASAYGETFDQLIRAERLKVSLNDIKISVRSYNDETSDWGYRALCRR